MSGAGGGARLAARAGLPLAVGLALLLTWEGIARAGWVDPAFVAAPSAVAATLWELIATGRILPHFLFTIGGAALGLALAIVLGVTLGVLAGLSPAVRRVAGPYLAALNATPRVALIPLLIMWLGLGLGTRVTLVVLSAFFPVFFNAAEGVQAVDPALKRVGDAFGCNGWERFTQIVLPSALPHILTGVRLAVGRGLIVVVIAEMFVGSFGGMGYFIIASGQSFQAAAVFAGAAIMALTGYLLTQALQWLEGRLTPWHQRITF